MQAQDLLKRSDMNWPRKIWHITWGVLILGLWLNLNQSMKFWGVIYIVIACIGFAFDFYRLSNQRANILLIKYLGIFMRNTEVRSFTGLPFYTLGVGLTLLFFDPVAAFLGISFLVLADPIASIVGILSRQKEFLPNKTLYGCIAFFITACLICTVYFLPAGEDGKFILFVMACSMLVTLAEFSSTFNIDDNLVIPLVGAMSVASLNYFFSIY